MYLFFPRPICGRMSFECLWSCTTSSVGESVLDYSQSSRKRRQTSISHLPLATCLPSNQAYSSPSSLMVVLPPCWKNWLLPFISLVNLSTSLEWKRCSTSLPCKRYVFFVMKEKWKRRTLLIQPPLFLGKVHVSQGCRSSFPKIRLDVIASSWWTSQDHAW